MSLLLLNLLQQGRLSKVVIVGAALLFIAGVSLLVYFYRRYRRIEKEPEEDWDLSRRSLFVNVAPPTRTAEEASDKAVPTTPAPEITHVVPGGTRELFSEPHLQSSTPASTTPASSKPPRETEAPVPPIEPATPPVKVIEPSPEPIGPIGPIGPIKKPVSEHEHTAFDEEVWAGLEVEEPSSTQDHPGETTPLHAVTERLPAARVDERSHRELFEPPRIERVLHREPFEPPSIKPLTPREQAAVTRELRSSPPPRTPETRDVASENPARDTMIFGANPSERDQRPSSAQPPGAEPVIAASARIAEPSLAGARSQKAHAGSILGLPAEGSHGPLILGEPVRAESEAGIGALTNYGKDLSPKAGSGGTIALLIVVALLGGALLLYLFVPSVHSRVSAFVGRVRGTDSQASMKPKVQIFPSFRQEVNKNMVTAKGAIDNISDEPLENLEVEVALQRGADAPPEIRRIAVTPNPLPTNTRGNFEFEYDGKRDTGFVSGKVTRVFSNGSEIKFRAPSQP
jgi:hypothetical protein